MEVTERHEVALEQPAQEAQVHPVSELGVQVTNLQVDLEQKKTEL